jgi:prephenate dehydrogenase
MWVPIFLQNAANILPILDLYMGKLREFRSYLEAENEEGLSGFIREANRIRPVLENRGA